MFNLVVTCVGKKDENYNGPSINEFINNLTRRGIHDNVDALFKEWKEMLIQKMKTFFITRKLLPDIRVALVGSLFVAVSPAGVFATSHPMPGAIGDLLALLVLFFYLQLSDGRGKNVGKGKNNESGS